MDSVFLEDEQNELILLSCHSGLTGETDPSLGAGRQPIKSLGPRMNIFFLVFRRTVLLTSLGPTDSHDWFL